MSQTLRLASLTALTMLAFAANSLLCRLALRDTAIDAATFTSIRLAAGALVLVLIVLARRGSPMAAGSWRGGLLLFGYAAFFSFAYRELSAATGALLLFGAVQATMLASGLISGERLRAMQLAGLLVAAGGLVVLLLPGLAAPPPGAAGCMAAAGISWGFYSLLGRGAKDPIAATGGNFLCTLPFAALLGLATLASAQVDAMGCVYAILSGAIASGLGYVLWYLVLPALPAASAATIQLSVPALATIGGVVLLAEPMTSRLLACSIAILGGIALTLRRPTPRP